MRRHKKDLKAELYSSGGVPKQIDEYIKTAGQIKKAGVPKLSRRSKRRLARQLGVSRWHRPSLKPLLLASSTLVAMLVIVIVLAQTAKPGSVLYLLKRGSENARALVEPNYQDEIAARRKAELETLVQQKADATQIIKAEDDFNKALVKSSPNTQERLREKSDDSSGYNQELKQSQVEGTHTQNPDD